MTGRRGNALPLRSSCAASGSTRARMSMRDGSMTTTAFAIAMARTKNPCAAYKPTAVA
jgi:hypothetical protein